jgi:hypothetical protein
MRWIFYFAILLSVTGCGNATNAEIPDSELHAKARTLALPARYDLYVEVLRSQIPSRPILAGDIAALGEPAWKYVLSRALGGDYLEISEALPALSAFSRRCSLEELEQLRAHVGHASSGDMARSLTALVETTCGSELPAHD